MECILTLKQKEEFSLDYLYHLIFLHSLNCLRCIYSLSSKQGSWNVILIFIKALNDIQVFYNHIMLICFQTLCDSFCSILIYWHKIMSVLVYSSWALPTPQSTKPLQFKWVFKITKTFWSSLFASGHVYIFIYIHLFMFLYIRHPFISRN